MCIDETQIMEKKMPKTFGQLLEKYMGEGVCCFDDLRSMEAQHLTAALIREKDLLGEWDFIKKLNSSDNLITLLIKSLDTRLTTDLQGSDAHLQAMLQQGALAWGQQVIAEAIASALADSVDEEE